MNKVLQSCISDLNEMLQSSEMTLADRDQLRLVVARLEWLDHELADEHDVAKRRHFIMQAVEFAAKIGVHILMNQS